MCDVSTCVYRLGVGGGQLVSLIMIHGRALLFDVNGLLDFTSLPLLFSA